MWSYSATCSRLPARTRSALTLTWLRTSIRSEKSGAVRRIRWISFAIRA